MEERLKQKTIEEIEATKELMLRNNPSYNFMTLINGKSPFEKEKAYESLYTSATEDMRTYYKEFNHTKTFLTIGASGEQVMNAIEAGAEEIDVYDSNPLTKHAVNLRIAAQRNLSKEELLKFYEDFSVFTFANFGEDMPEESLLYWYGIYSSFPPEIAGKLVRDFLFTYKRLDRDLVISINPYLRGSAYKKVQERSKDVKINYLDSDLLNLPKVIGSRKYDAMTFSNIYEYLNYNTKVTRKKAKEFRDFVVNAMKPHLTDNGTMMFAYMYAFSEALKQDFDEMHRRHPEKLCGTGALTLDRYYDYINGHTTQNLAYSLLLDEVKDDDVLLVQTNHVQFGQSKDMSHDLALCLRKK